MKDALAVAGWLHKAGWWYAFYRSRHTGGAGDLGVIYIKL
jgi:hypothetical protein